MRRLGILGVLSMLLSLVGCMKATEETIVIPVRNRVIPETVLSSAYQDSISCYMNIYEGDNPPNIEGSYIAAPMSLVFSSDGYENEFYNMFWKVSGQNWWNRVDYQEWQGDAEGVAHEAWVIGSGNRFTLYTVEQSRHNRQGWEYDAVLILSGEKTDAGIVDYHYAIVMRSKNDSCSVLIEPDSYRVFKDGDSLSSVSNGK